MVRKQQYIEFDSERFGTKHGKVIDVRDGYLVVLIEIDNEKRGAGCVKERVIHVDMLCQEFIFVDAPAENRAKDRIIR